MWWKRYAWFLLYQQISLLLDYCVLEKPPAIHVLIAWSVFQAHVHWCSLCHCFLHGFSENKLTLEKFLAWTRIRPLLPLQPLPNYPSWVREWNASITGMGACYAHGFLQACVINLEEGSVFKSAAKRGLYPTAEPCVSGLCCGAPELTLTGGFSLDGV